MLIRTRAITAAGIVLSHPTIKTRPSNRCPRATSSIESAITSRLTSEAFIPSVPIETPSETAMVLNSMGVPPAARMAAALARTAHQVGIRHDERAEHRDADPDPLPAGRHLTQPDGGEQRH